MKTKIIKNYEPSEFGDFEISSTKVIEYCNKCDNLKNEIQSLKAQIELLEKAVDYYASYENMENIVEDSEQIFEFNYACGKLARQTKQELEKLR